MKLSNKVLALSLSVVMIVSAAGCSKGTIGGNDTGVSADRTYSYWIASGEDSSYYSTYEENPGIQYLLTQSYGTDENGKDIKVDFNFQVPVSGKQQDNFNTLLATGEYTDVLDMAFSTSSAAELYEQGIALDITEYVEKYMPNYLAFLEAHPDLKLTSTNVVDGEKKYLQLYNYNDALPYMWEGYIYRRDWLVKYGTNPQDGSSFSGEYTLTNEDGTPNIDSWVDNVIFPSGGSDPVYISDWEWMLGIFKTAIEDLKIADGYCMSLYYPGFMGAGDLVCAFGGGGPAWYKQDENTIINGADKEDFRVYLQCMNTWYKNGWIDTAFSEHATDMFYKIDQPKVFSGKVGLWCGTAATLGGRLADPTSPYLDGYVAYFARQPINDIYGTEAQQNKTPYCMYQQSLETTSTIITDKASKKDLVALFKFLDYMYSEEGSIIKNIGLNKEQFEVTQSEFYKTYGLTDGAYYEVTTDAGEKKLQLVDTLLKDGGTLQTASKALRIAGLANMSLISHEWETDTYKHNFEEWTFYNNTGYLSTSFIAQLSSEDAATYSKIQVNSTEFMNKSIPGFVSGKKDPFNDDDWNSYVKALSKYNPDAVTKIFQALLDSLK